MRGYGYGIESEPEPEPEHDVPRFCFLSVKYWISKWRVRFLSVWCRVVFRVEVGIRILSEDLWFFRDLSSF